MKVAAVVVVVVVVDGTKKGDTCDCQNYSRLVIIVALAPSSVRKQTQQLEVDQFIVSRLLSIVAVVVVVVVVVDVIVPQVLVTRSFR